MFWFCYCTPVCCRRQAGRWGARQILLIEFYRYFALLAAGKPHGARRFFSMLCYRYVSPRASIVTPLRSIKHYPKQRMLKLKSQGLTLSQTLTRNTLIMVLLKTRCPYSWDSRANSVAHGSRACSGHFLLSNSPRLSYCATRRGSG